MKTVRRVREMPKVSRIFVVSGDKPFRLEITDKVLATADPYVRTYLISTHQSRCNTFSYRLNERTTPGLYGFLASTTWKHPIYKKTRCFDIRVILNSLDCVSS
jgi:hypothetical protein